MTTPSTCPTCHLPYPASPIERAVRQAITVEVADAIRAEAIRLRDARLAPRIAKLRTAGGAAPLHPLAGFVVAAWWSAGGWWKVFSGTHPTRAAAENVARHLPRCWVSRTVMEIVP